MSSRILVLDGIRGFALCMVLTQHFFGTREAKQALGAFDRVVFGLVDSGWWAIDSFFILSAFLITGILWDTKGRARYFLDFYARRTLRIFPLYYAALCVLFVVLPRIPHPMGAGYVRDSLPDQVFFWTYLVNFRMAGLGDWYDTLAPTVFWSLAVEEQFYLLWPLVVLLCTRRTLIRLCLSMMGLALGVRIALALAGVSPVATFVLTPARMDCLAIGGLMALLWRDADAFARLARLARRALPALVLILVLLALPHGKLDWRDPLTNTLGFSVTALMCAAILTLAIQARPGAGIRRFFEHAALRRLGQYSYAMYIFHGPAGSLVKQAYDFDRAPLVWGSALPLVLVYCVLASLVTLVVGWLSWNLLERHFLRLQAAFRGSTPPAGAPSPVKPRPAHPPGVAHPSSAVQPQE